MLHRSLYARNSDLIIAGIALCDILLVVVLCKTLAIAQHMRRSHAVRIDPCGALGGRYALKLLHFKLRDRCHAHIIGDDNGFIALIVIEQYLLAY